MSAPRVLVCLSALFALSFNGCGGEECPNGFDPIDGLCPCSDGSAQVDGECPCDDGTYPADNPDGECLADCAAGFVDVDGDCLFECDDGTTVEDEFDCPVYFEPAAVGFQYLGGFEDGEWVSYEDVDASGAGFTIEPLILLQFADIEYFSGAGTSCEVFARVSTETSTEPIPVIAGGTVWNSWEMALELDPAAWEAAIGDQGACNMLVDPALYGENGQELFDAFDGMHFGMGFGPPTENLITTLEGFEGGAEFIAEDGDALFTEFIAINDAAGTWIGEDWSYGFSLEWDPTTRTVIRDAEGLGAFQDIAGTIPNGAIVSGSIWLQDFPLMDLSNLADGAPQ